MMNQIMTVFDITSHVQCSPVLSDIDKSAVKNVPTTSSVLEGPSNIKFKKPRTNKLMKSGRDLVRYCNKAYFESCQSVKKGAALQNSLDQKSHEIKGGDQEMAAMVSI